MCDAPAQLGLGRARIDRATRPTMNVLGRRAITCDAVRSAECAGRSEGGEKERVRPRREPTSWSSSGFLGHDPERLIGIISIYLLQLYTRS